MGKILDAGCWILDAGYKKAHGSRRTVARCWLLDEYFIELIGLIELMVNRSQVIEVIDRAVFFQSAIRNHKSPIERL
jgi:hypothetical protein